MIGTLNQQAVKYLEGRKLQADLAGQYQLHSAAKADGKAHAADDRAGMLAIPYFVGDRVVFWKYRKLYELKADEASWAAHGKRLVLWNNAVIADPGLQDEPLIITEGEWDALAAIQSGHQRTVSVPNGAAEDAPPESLSFMVEHKAELAKVRKIILATDNDNAGEVLRNNLLFHLGRARCYTVTYPLIAKGADRRCKDLNEVLERYGEEGVNRAIKLAQPVPMDGLFSYDNLPDEPPDMPALKVAAFGPDVENMIGFRPGDLSFFTGQPGGGKTTLLRGLSWALAEEHGVKTACAFFEDKPKRDTVRNLKRLWGNGWPSADREAEAQEWMRNYYQWIIKLGFQELPTVDWFLDQAEAAVIRHGCSLIIADPWSQFAIRTRKGEDKLELILENVLKLKSFAVTMNVHVSVIAHPRKPDTYGGSEKLPDGYDIAGSKEFFDRCDMGVTVQADPRAKFLTNVKIWKIRDREEQGDKGEFSLRLSPHSKRFAALHPEDAAILRGDDKIIPIKGRGYERARRYEQD